MGRTELIGRVKRAVERRSYLVPVERQHPSLRAPMAEIAAMLRSPDAERWQIDARIDALRVSGALDEATAWSVRGVVAAHPRFADYLDALRCAALQEQAALSAGGDDLRARLAAVDRHRGVVAFLMDRPQVALEQFTLALERERSAENLANVLCALVRLGDLDAARELLSDVRRAFPADIREGVEWAVANDADLAGL